MDIYDLYKPFRNSLRKMALGLALERIWQYQAHVDVSGTLKLRMKVGGPVSEIYVWELHLLCRETLLHASGDKDTLATHEGLFTMINHIRRISEGISKCTISSNNDAVCALHTLIHQQVRWQYPQDEARMFRAFYIYSDPELAPIFKRVTDLSVREMFFLAIGIAGAGKKKVVTSTAQDYSAFGVAHEARDKFFKMTGTTLTNIRRNIEDLQRHDEGWAFTWNPMESTPLINLDDHQTSIYWHPFPEFLIRRVTEGLFYDLGKGKRQAGIEFSNEYGRAFERYVLRVLHELFSSEPFSVTGELPYKVSGNVRHGVDAIVSDLTGNIFIECKTRRMKQEAKETADGSELEQSLDELAKAIVQLYKNIEDAINGVSNWNSNKRPIYPFVVTYEDWYLFVPHVLDLLNEYVKKRLEKAQLSRNLTETMPFFVTSIAEFEMAGQDIARLGIERFCAAGTLSEHRHFKLSHLAHTAFPDEHTIHHRLLKNCWNEIFPEMQAWAGMAGQTEGWWSKPEG